MCRLSTPIPLSEHFERNLQIFLGIPVAVLPLRIRLRAAVPRFVSCFFYFWPHLIFFLFTMILPLMMLVHFAHPLFRRPVNPHPFHVFHVGHTRTLTLP